MGPNMTAVQVAVRVLQAVLDHTQPAAMDIEFLGRLMPDLAAGPIDELACEIVHRELQRSKVRGAA